MGEQNRAEKRKIKKLYYELIHHEKYLFPKERKRIDIPSKHGVYIIYKKNEILYVGRSISGKDGLFQRLKNHLHGSSSFTRNHHPKLRTECRYSYLKVRNERERALLEALTIGKLCPEYVGTGKKKVK